MIKATLKHFNNNGHIETERIELPDVITTDDILSVIADNKKNFDYEDWMEGDGDTFIIELGGGRRFYYLESPYIFKKWSIYWQTPDCYCKLVAKFNYYKEYKNEILQV